MWLQRGQGRKGTSSTAHAQNQDPPTHPTPLSKRDVRQLNPQNPFLPSVPPPRAWAHLAIWSAPWPRHPHPCLIKDITASLLFSPKETAVSFPGLLGPSSGICLPRVLLHSVRLEPGGDIGRGLTTQAGGVGGRQRTRRPAAAEPGSARGGSRNASVAAGGRRMGCRAPAEASTRVRGPPRRPRPRRACGGEARRGLVQVFCTCEIREGLAVGSP